MRSGDRERSRDERPRGREQLGRLGAARAKRESTESGGCGRTGAGKGSALQRSSPHDQSTSPNRRSASPGKRSRIRWDRLALLITLLLSLVALFLTYFHTGVFHVSEFRVTGNRRLEPAYIISLSGVGPEDNLLTLNKDSVIARLEEEPWVKKARIRRHFPDVLELIVEEREAVAQVPYPEGYMLVDLEGVLLEFSPQPWEGYPKVQAESQVYSEAGCRLSSEEFRRQAEILAVLGGSLRSRVACVGVEEERGSYLVTSEGVHVFLGNGDDLPLKLENAFAIMDDPLVRKQHPWIEYVDVSNPEQPVMRPRTT